MTDYAKWDKFADDISDDDAPKTELKLPKARAHSASAFPGRLIACVENVENAYPHYYDWTMINDGDDGDFVVLAHDPTQQQVDHLPKLQARRHGAVFAHTSLCGYYADPDVMPIVPIQQWLRRFDRDEPLQKEHLLVVGVIKAVPGRRRGRPSSFAGGASRPPPKKHPVLLDAAGRPGSPSEALTSAVISHLQKWNPSALQKLPDSAATDGHSYKVLARRRARAALPGLWLLPVGGQRLSGSRRASAAVQKAARPGSGCVV